MEIKKLLNSWSLGQCFSIFITFKLKYILLPTSFVLGRMCKLFEQPNFHSSCFLKLLIILIISATSLLLVQLKNSRSTDEHVLLFSNWLLSIYNKHQEQEKITNDGAVVKSSLLPKHTDSCRHDCFPCKDHQTAGRVQLSFHEVFFSLDTHHNYCNLCWIIN